VRVTVRLFARLRETVGADALTYDLPDTATVGDVWARVAATHPAVAPFASSVSCAVNAEFARPGTGLRDGDEVAFLPPVSGGSFEVRSR
jgi:molybdopterin converting factor subunit 1